MRFYHILVTTTAASKVDSNQHKSFKGVFTINHFLIIYRHATLQVITCIKIILKIAVMGILKHSLTDRSTHLDKR